jgi:beta-lactamase class A
MTSTPPPSRRGRITWYQVALTLTADLVVLLAFLFFALGSASLDIRASPLPPAAPIVPTPPAPPWPPTARLLAIEEGIGATPSEDVQLSIALQDADGRSLVSVGESQPYVLASVSKLYLMVAYLAQVEAAGERLGEDDLDLLDPMIRYSDNRTATRTWERIGKLDGINDFLASHNLRPLTLVEDDAWGTLEASPAEVAELVRLLAQGALLAPESTQLAMRLLSRIDDEQDWGISSGVSEDGTVVYLKNGWYPEEDGWRINSAGAVQTPKGTYYLAVFAYPTPTMEDGIDRIEDVASLINAAMR